MTPCVEPNKQEQQLSPNSIFDLHVPDLDIMTSDTADASATEEDSIKAAVRDAAKKTQDRLAAYQQKQAAKAAAAAAEEANKAPSKSRVEADNTVSRLQALVSESKRLTTQSRVLNTTNVAVAAAAQDTTAQKAAAPGFHRSNTVGDPSSLRRQAAATASMDSSMNSSARLTAPKGKKLSEIFQTLGPGGNASSSANMMMSQSQHNASSSHGMMGSLEKDNSVRSLLPAVESAMTQSSLAQWQHKREQQKESAEKDSSKKSKRGSKTDVVDDSEDNDGSSDMDIDIDDDDDDDDDIDDIDESESDHHGDKKKKGTKPQQEQQPEVNGGDFSILSMVEQKKKQTEGREEVEEMIEEYYSTPAAAGATEQQDDEPDHNVMERPKLNQNTSMGSNKKKRMPRRPQTKQEKAAAAPPPAPAAQAEENMEEDMPVLAPFETPKVSKPKFGTQEALSVASSQQQKDNKNEDDDNFPGMEKSMSQEEAESSLSLSMVFHSSKKFEGSPQESPKTKSPQRARSKSPQPPPQAAAPIKSALRRPSMEPSQPPSQSPLNLSKLPLIGDNPNSRVAPEHDGDDDDNKSTVSSSSSRHRRSTRTGRGRDDNSSQRSMRSRSSRSQSRTRVKRRASLKGGPKRGSKGEKKSLSVIDKYHKKAEESLQSFPDEVSVEDQSKNDGDGKQTGLDASELSRSSESSDGGGRDEIGTSQSMDDDSAESLLSTDSSKTSGSTRRGRSSMDDKSTRSRRDIGRSRSRTREVGRQAPPSRSVSRSGSSRRGGRRLKGNGMVDGSMKDMMSASAREPSSHRKSRLNKDGNSSLRDMNAGSMKDMMSASAREPSSHRKSRLNRDGNSSLRDMNASARESGSARRRRSISTRRGTGRRSQRRGSSDGDEDETEASTADEILGSLDVSDIKIVGEDDGDDKMDSSIMDDSSRASIYDSKKKRASMKSGTGSLAGLSKLQAGGGPEDGEASVSESIKSTASKKSMLGNFARTVGRKLTMKGGKKKSDAGDDEDEDGTETEDVAQTDLELAALAAEFDEEEKRIEAAGSSEVPDLGSSKGENVEPPDFQKAKKKRQSTVFGAIKKVGSKITKKKKKKVKDSEVLDSDSDSNDNDNLLSECSGGTLDRSHSDSEGDDQGGGDFAQLQINGDKASIAMCGSDRSEEEAVRVAQPKGRQRRTGSSMRRQGADRQRTRQSLQAVLGSTAESAAGNEDASVVTTDTKTRVRRAKSVRGPRTQRNKTNEGEVKRHKSVKGRIEGDNSSRIEKSRRLRRANTSDYDSKDEATPPPFDWKAYSADKPAKKSKEKRRPKADKADNTKRMSGGLSAVIYHGQAVAS